MDEQFKGMTVNERLYVSGLINEFEVAVVNKNKEKIIEILKKVEITDEYSIKMILDSLLAQASCLCYE